MAPKLVLVGAAAAVSLALLMWIIGSSAIGIAAGAAAACKGVRRLPRRSRTLSRHRLFAKRGERDRTHAVILAYRHGPVRPGG